MKKEELKILRAYIKTYENVSFECKAVEYKNKETGEIKTQLSSSELKDYEKVIDEEKEKEQEEVKSQINKSIVYNYAHDTEVLK